MDIVDILITIGVIVYIILAALPRKKKSVKKSEALPKAGWRKKVEDFLENIREEMERAAGEEPMVGPTDAGLEGAGKMERGALHPPPFRPEAKGEVPCSRPPVEAFPKDEIALSGEIDRLVRRRKWGEVDERPVPCRGRRKRKMGAKDLRNAVVWSEILSPPVSLRDREPETRQRFCK